jgi:hypothetical protein
VIRLIRPANSLAVAAAFVALSAPVAGAREPVYFGGDVAGLVRMRPSFIHMTSDENLRKIKWSSWGGARASGAGTAVFSASDGVPPSPVSLRLSNRHRCGGKLRYLTLRIAPRIAEVSVVRYTCRSPF